MLHIYSSTIDIARDAGHAARSIAHHDADLARQLRRAATSIALNVAEGSGVLGGNRRQRYATALGSARETRACFEVAIAMDYIAPLDLDTQDRLDKVIATLVKVSR
jgi:four helix bundle protein